MGIQLQWVWRRWVFDPAPSWRHCKLIALKGKTKVIIGRFDPAPMQAVTALKDKTCLPLGVLTQVRRRWVSDPCQGDVDDNESEGQSGIRHNTDSGVNAIHSRLFMGIKCGICAPPCPAAVSTSTMMLKWEPIKPWAIQDRPSMHFALRRTRGNSWTHFLVCYWTHSFEPDSLCTRFDDRYMGPRTTMVCGSWPDVVVLRMTTGRRWFQPTERRGNQRTVKRSPVHVLWRVPCDSEVRKVVGTEKIAQPLTEMMTFGECQQLPLPRLVRLNLILAAQFVPHSA
ncbi:hypothetical protein C8R45DRAFT_933015 [Mycena sanguinolenta]|nr:hypothetical protein C8R45DRAFT_933015 [Mycena sanguinolenta]